MLARTWKTYEQTWRNNESWFCVDKFDSGDWWCKSAARSSCGSTSLQFRTRISLPSNKAIWLLRRSEASLEVLNIAKWLLRCHATTWNWTVSNGSHVRDLQVSMFYSGFFFYCSLCTQMHWAYLLLSHWGFLAIVWLFKLLSIPGLECLDLAILMYWFCIRVL